VERKAQGETHGVCRLGRTVHQDLPLSHVLLIEVDFHARRRVGHALAVLLRRRQYTAFPISYERLAFMMRFFAPVLMIAVG
jgi:hypothetical protein